MAQCLFEYKSDWIFILKADFSLYWLCVYTISQQSISHLHWPRHLELYLSDLTYSSARVINLRSRWQKWALILCKGLGYTAFERKTFLSIHLSLPILKWMGFFV